MPLHRRDNLDKYIETLAYNPEAHAYDNVHYTILGAIHDGAEAPEYLKVQINEAGAEFDWQIIAAS